MASPEDDDSGNAKGNGSEGDEGIGALALDKRKALLAVLGALLLAGGAFAGLTQITSGNRLSRAVSDSDKTLVAVAFVGQLVAYLGYTLAYRDAARASGGPNFAFLAALRIVVFGAGTAILGASVGGLAVDFWALRRTGTESHVAARRVLAVGTLEWTVLSVYAFSAAVVVLAAGITAPLTMDLGWLIAIPFCVLAARWLTSPPRVEPLINPDLPSAGSGASAPRRAGTWVLNKLRAGLGDGLAGVVLVRHLVGHPTRYLGATIGYPIYWAGDIFTLYISTRAFGGSPNLAALVLAYATGYVISSLPLPAGGAGGVEATVALALHATGVDWTAALLGVFLYRLFTFWLPLVPALALLPSIRRLSDELESTPHTERDADEQPSFRPADSRGT